MLRSRIFGIRAAVPRVARDGQTRSLHHGNGSQGTPLRCKRNSGPSNRLIWHSSPGRDCIVGFHLDFQSHDVGLRPGFQPRLPSALRLPGCLDLLELIEVSRHAWRPQRARPRRPLKGHMRRLTLNSTYEPTDKDCWGRPNFDSPAKGHRQRALQRGAEELLRFACKRVQETCRLWDLSDTLVR